MIRVTHIITGLGPGGAETMLYKLLSRMDPACFQNSVISLTDEGRIAEDIRKMSIPVHSLGLKPGRPHPFGLWRLIRILKEQRTDVVQTWLYHADFLGLVSSKLTGVRAVAWNLRCTDLRLKDHSLFLFWMLRVLARLSLLPDAVVVNSRAGREVHEKMGYRPRRWEVIPNGFDTTIFCPSLETRPAVRNSLDVSGQTFLVGLVARFHAMKDHATFLKAASLICKERSDVHFVMVGQGVDNSNETLMEQVEALGLGEHIHLLGEREDVSVIMSSLDVAVSASYSEGFSNVIGEAMACAVPCVVTNVGDSAYIVGDTGKVVPPGNPESMATALGELLSMEGSRRRALGLAARERVISLFSLDRVVQQYEDLYRNIFPEFSDVKPNSRDLEGRDAQGL